MKFGLAASLYLLPGLALTSFRQDSWYVMAHHTWQVENPLTYWISTCVALIALVVVARRLRAW